eukprot:TRINITY_DN304_c0_g2_i3.p1 TRINITY_DN304_c0_g2~~TRINITY_DN304_c0_g2_i3.p1  ORF type:complete len:491 (-),score=77.97 TRINITY_DN304_c0_g2_i3:202-1674(-)
MAMSVDADAEDFGGGPYKPLGKQRSRTEWSTARRLAVVITAILACLTNAGLAFGFSALLPVLVSLGAFHDACSPSFPLHESCDAQLSALTGMFTLATSMLNVAALPSGAALDALGPSRAAVCFALLTAAGCALFAYGGPGPFGDFAYVGTLSFSNLFPAQKGLVCAALVGCFDASSAVFVFLGAAIRAGVPFAAVFGGYSGVPLVVALIAAVLWPRAAIDPPSAASSGAAATSAQAAVGRLRGCGIRQQVFSLEFFLLTQTVCILMVCINYFIATVFHQLQEIDLQNALALTQAFAIMLPLGGIVYAPLIGKLVDGFGPIVCYGFLWLLYIIFYLLMDLYALTHATAAAYAAFAVFALVRPFFYTLGASFTGEVFGFDTFGKVYGLVNTIAGLANLLIQPLTSLALVEGFRFTNAVVLTVQLTTMAMPACMFWTGRKETALSAQVDGLSVYWSPMRRGISDESTGSPSAREEAEVAQMCRARSISCHGTI